MSKLNQNMIAALEKSGEALGMAQQLLEGFETRKQAANALVPETLRFLKAAGVVAPEQESLVQQHLGDHPKALQIICKLAERVATLERPQKQADAGSLGTAVPRGSVKEGSERLRSDRAFDHWLGKK